MVPKIAERIAIWIIVINHGAAGKINFNVSAKGALADVNKLNGTAMIIDATKSMYNSPTSVIEYVSARGTFFSGLRTTLNKDAADSKPKKPKIAMRDAPKTFRYPYGANGVNKLKSAFVQHMTTIASRGKTVVQIKILWPS